MKVLETVLREAQNIVGEYAVVAALQHVCIRFWKTTLLVLGLLAWGCWDIISSCYAMVREFSLEQVVTDHPYSTMILTIFVLWLISGQIGKIGKR